MTILRQEVLGHGSDGAVWETSRESVVKVLHRQENFRNELLCYQRLKEADVIKIGQFAVPALEGFDESLFAIEMSIVNPPYLLDFGKVYIDTPPPYWGDKQLMQNAYAEWRERFGRDWRTVASAVALLKEQFGIYYVDPRPSNICTGNEVDDDPVQSPPADFDSEEDCA